MKGTSPFKAGSWWWVMLQYSDTDVQDIYLQQDEDNYCRNGETKLD